MADTSLLPTTPSPFTVTPPSSLSLVPAPCKQPCRGLFQTRIVSGGESPAKQQYTATLNDWLRPEIYEQRELKELMKPCPDEWLSAEEISSLVNSPKNNSPEILQPAVVVRAKGPQRLFFQD